MRILCNLNPDFESSEFPWRISCDGITHLVKSVAWNVPTRTEFVAEFGKQGGYVIAADGVLTVDADCSLAVVKSNPTQAPKCVP